LILLVFLSGTACYADDEPSRPVLKALVDAAEKNAKRPLATDPGAREPFRVSGDELTELLLRAAATAADGLPQKQQASAFLLAVAIGLDDSTILRSNPLTSKLVKRVESDDERKQRLAVLGNPAMRGRRDLCQHFAVSCGLAALLGESLAETAGIAKEQKDSRGGSGFSFVDLQADLAGIALATRLQKGTLSVATLARKFKVGDFLPEEKGLREGLTAEQFEKDYGSLSDERFKKELSVVRKRVEALPGYKTP